LSGPFCLSANVLPQAHLSVFQKFSPSNFLTIRSPGSNYSIILHFPLRLRGAPFHCRPLQPGPILFFDQAGGCLPLSMKYPMKRSPGTPAAPFSPFPNQRDVCEFFLSSLRRNLNLFRHHSAVRGIDRMGRARFRFPKTHRPVRHASGPS